MKISPLKLKGTFEIQLNMIGDSRGYFMETFSEKVFAEYGIENRWIQENQSLSTQINTVRGLHFQTPPYTQAKLVRVVTGRILDVFVDLRKDSATYGQWDSIEISGDNNKMALIPRGFAHGFCTLSEQTLVQYKVDNYYSPSNDQGIRWNDLEIGIEWGLDENQALVSERDRSLVFFKDFDSPFLQERV